jgi:uncharacterized delta-60 repeat protein
MKRKFLGRAAFPLLAVCMGLVACAKTTTTSTPAPPTAFAVLRLTSAGVPDQAFAAGRGIAVTDIDPSLFDFAMTAAVQPIDNFILAGGSSGLAGAGVIALVRYDQNGTLDTTGFGTASTGGIVRTPTPAGWTSASATAIAVQPADNKIVVAALTFNASTGNTGIALLRYNANGTLDTGFGAPNGFVIATIGPGNATDTCALALQGTNIIVAGASSDGNVFLSRYDKNGALDTAFGTTSGVTRTSIGATASSPALAFQSTGNIILVSGNGSDQVVLRYTANGTLDTTFNASGNPPGIVTTDIGGGSINFANAVAVLFDDRIVVVGHANVNVNTDASDISLVRYTVDGAVDTTFGTNGIVTTDLSARFDNAFSVALQTPLAVNTNIIVSGNTGSGGFSQIAVLRYTDAGAPDPTFGVGGAVIVNLAGPSNIASGNAVVLQGGAIVVAGYD